MDFPAFLGVPFGKPAICSAVCIPPAKRREFVYNKIGTLLSDNQVELFHKPLVLRTAFHNIDSGGFDAGVAEKVRQLCHVLVQAVKCLGK